MNGATRGGDDPGGERVARLARELDALGLDALLVDSLVDVRYLTSFTGSNAIVIVIGDAAQARLGSHRFVSDFRYKTQAVAQVPDAFAREIVTGELVDALANALTVPSGRLGYDETSLTVKSHRKLAESLPEGWELVATTDCVRRLRAVKDARELAHIRAAATLADEALRSLLEAGLVGRTEREVAIELELRMRRLGAHGPSFPTIVAAGAHGALPHAEPRDERIPADVLVTIDWGALHEGYCSDCTRTFATGEGVSEQAREVYDLVLSAQREGVAAVHAGPSGREVDALVRGLIERAGHGEHFGHGLGHGVGLDVHEAPRLSRTAPGTPLRAGNVITVEPGVYLPGVLGVRVEDLVVVGDEAHEVLTSLPKELAVVS